MIYRKTRDRLFIPFPLVGPGSDRPSYAILTRRFSGYMGKTSCGAGEGSWPGFGDGGDRPSWPALGPWAGQK